MKENPNHFQFLSSDGETQVMATSWQTNHEPIGVVQIVHGMREHIMRYDDFARFLNSFGYIVYGHDHLGHGRTGATANSYGYFGETEGAKVLVDDATQLTTIIAENHPELPIFLLGHSMGSFITRLQILHVGYLLTGYICMGTGGKNPGAPIMRGVTGLLSKIKGGKGESNTVNKIFDGVFTRKLEKGESADAWITYDTDNVENYINDNFTRFHFTLAGYNDLFDLQMATNRDDWYSKLDRSLPFLLVSGEDDPVGDYGKGIKEVCNKLKEQAQLDDVTCILYENMRHEILNETGKAVVYADILGWLNDHNEYLKTNTEGDK